MADDTQDTTKCTPPFMHRVSQGSTQIQESREDIRKILANGNGRYGRVIVFIGPCSVHSTEATLNYAKLLARAAATHRDDLLVVMRVYIEKPRTTVGWKGFVHDPDLSESVADSSTRVADLSKGLWLSRQLMLDITQLGLPVVTEVLTPLVVPFIDDLLCCGVIGARTTESQTHRELASGLDMPVGFKNGTDGSLDVATNAMVSAAGPHSLITVNDHGQMIQQRTNGNESTFLILRGGRSGPNYSEDHTYSASAAVTKAGHGQPGVVVDCSHGNSNKDYRNQAQVATSIAGQIAKGAPVVGVMIESNINEGRQDIASAATPEGLKYGVSVTDGCVGWQETEVILKLLASAVQKHRRQRHDCDFDIQPLGNELQAKSEEIEVHVEELVFVDKRI
ncbi:hypothetical protein KVR01_005215 [Diaporthe batatas]|uniref:uncharacterized protein n=1 Tax=Diaporthe batatas TaxID=748121 RepID=UPI001D058734|nr:uncharacterized protein KVR01_005215 [Diaporthe batatas]KAG8164940.1 hypothetical protein KVR01_005215 [Diaporthe batatas]